ncbi:MAG TPA: 3'-5' exonuclease [Candidatus Synoicihabitans sp.]|nr:3'-5' exonuclease [Candidatus Synoicihabitans sp.]
MLSWLRRSPLSPLAQAYRDATRPRVPRRCALHELTLMVLDTEATGFVVGKDRMLAIAIVEIRAGRIEIGRTASWLLRQPVAAVNDAMAVHGILPHDTADGVPEADVLAQLLPRLTGAVLVGHHVRFDAAMLDEALLRHHRVRLRNPLVDTARMAMSGIDAFRKSGYENQRPPTLEELCAHTGLPVMARHTAPGDAFTTAQLFLLLCARLRRRLGRELRAADLPLDRL